MQGDVGLVAQRHTSLIARVAGTRRRQRLAAAAGQSVATFPPSVGTSASALAAFLPSKRHGRRRRGASATIVKSPAAAQGIGPGARDGLPV